MNEIKEFIKGLGDGMRLFGETISSLVNNFLLTGVFFLVVGPTALLAKVFGKSFLPTERLEWVVRKGKQKSFYRQF